MEVIKKEVFKKWLTRKKCDVSNERGSPRIEKCDKCGLLTPYRVRFLYGEGFYQRHICDRCYNDYKKYAIKCLKILLSCMLFVILLCIGIAIFLRGH